MSVTSEIKSKGAFYQLVLSHIDIDKSDTLIKEHQERLGALYCPAVPGTDFPLAGMAVIYAVRDYQASRLGLGPYWFPETVAGSEIRYPASVGGAARYVLMALADKQARTRQHYHLKSLLPSFKETVEDVSQIVSTFLVTLPEPNMPFIPNPCWIGGADGNLLMNQCLWDIRTTQARSPLTLDNIVQQAAYVLINRGKYRIDSLGVYYSRQQCYFEYPLNRILKPGVNALNESDAPLVDLK